MLLPFKPTGGLAQDEGCFESRIENFSAIGNLKKRRGNSHELTTRASYPPCLQSPGLIGFPFIFQWDGADSQGLTSWLHDLQTS